MKPVVYEGEIPPALLEGKITEEKFYSAQELRQILLDTCPETDDNPFDGLFRIVTSMLFRRLGLPCSAAEYRKIIAGKTRDEAVKQLIPEYDGHNLEIEIEEAPDYIKQGDTGFNRYQSHVVKLELIDVGYLAEITTARNNFSQEDRMKM